MLIMRVNPNKKQILISVLETVECISGKEYQKRVWIREEGLKVDDFDETCCNFFGDGDPIYRKLQRFWVIGLSIFLVRKIQR